MSQTPTILFAGGGSGGHIYPGLAVWEEVQDRVSGARCHFLVSTRPLDREILEIEGVPYTAIDARAWGVNPLAWPGCAVSLWRGVAAARRVIRERKPAALVAMGGFVSAPAVLAAVSTGLPIALVDLDGVRGKASRALGVFAAVRFGALGSGVGGREISVPIRRAALGPRDRGEARSLLGLEPHRETLLVVGGSQGARSINQMMVELMSGSAARSQLAGWQVLHIAGPGGVQGLADVYEAAGVSARVEAYCGKMGAAWASASVAISRAGAGSVAEAWANGTVTVFMPYPYHRDRHQEGNAEVLVRQGAAALVEDRVEPGSNAEHIWGELSRFTGDAEFRGRLSEGLRETWPGNGAEAVASWVKGACS